MELTAEKARAPWRRIGGTLLVGALAGLLAGGSGWLPVEPPTPAQSAGSPPVSINLLNINDFHGRIDGNTVKFAGTIEQLRAAGGEANTLLLSAGDNIGASLFASASAGDIPTIEVLNALDLDASAVGNHEFDQGYADLTGRVQPAATFNYLGANVYHAGTQNPALPEYEVRIVDGVRVGIVGVVTQDTPTAVKPGGVAMLEFGDPVAAVNRVAAQLTDGDPLNGEVDVVVAEYHDGAGSGSNRGSTLEDEVAAGGIFARIVTETNDSVAAIFTGHTHQSYAWDAPIPGATGATRPIVQTGSYGANVGQIVLTVDGDSHAVTSYTAGNVPRSSESEAALIAQFPRVAAVDTIVRDALAAAAIIGDTQIGSVTQDITTAYVNGARDDRSSESTLGNLVADALLHALAPPERGGAEIAIANPGGLRADLLYGGDGSVTFAQANAVLPFMNDLWTVNLTGAQVKEMLEQQWQTGEPGPGPTRNLGLSHNVSYTYDETRPAGDRVTGIFVDGNPIDAAAGYRVGMYQFLLQGGDGFTVFAQGSEPRDSGLVDREAWMDYLAAHSPVSPSFARRSVALAGVPTAELQPRQTVSFAVTKLNLTSLGSPANTSLEMRWDGELLGTVPVDASGTAAVSFSVPGLIVACERGGVANGNGAGTAAGIAPGSQPAGSVTGAPSSTATLELRAKESGTTVHIPFVVAHATVPDDDCEGPETVVPPPVIPPTTHVTPVTQPLAKTGAASATDPAALAAMGLALMLAGLWAALRARRLRRIPISRE